MTAAKRSYARALQRLAAIHVQLNAPVALTLDARSALHVAQILERGCDRSDYVSGVMREAERLRDMAEDQLLVAQDLNAAAERALSRARALERVLQAASLATVLAIVVVAGVLS